MQSQGVCFEYRLPRGKDGEGTTDEPECGHILCTYVLAHGLASSREADACQRGSCIASSSEDLAPNPTIGNMSRRQASGALIVSATIL